MKANTVVAISGLCFGPFITAFVVVSILSGIGVGTGLGFYYDVGSLAAELLIYGFGGFGLYYSIKHLIVKTKERSDKKKAILYWSILAVSALVLLAQIHISLIMLS